MFKYLFLLQIILFSYVNLCGGNRDRAPICTVTDINYVASGQHGSPGSGNGGFSWTVQKQSSTCNSNTLVKTSVYSVMLSGIPYKGLFVYIAEKGADSHRGAWTAIPYTSTKTCIGTSGPNTLQHSSSTIKQTPSVISWVSSFVAVVVLKDRKSVV